MAAASLTSVLWPSGVPSRLADLVVGDGSQGMHASAPRCQNCQVTRTLTRRHQGAGLGQTVPRSGTSTGSGTGREGLGFHLCPGGIRPSPPQGIPQRLARVPGSSRSAQVRTSSFWRLSPCYPLAGLWTSGLFPRHNEGALSFWTHPGPITLGPATERARTERKALAGPAK